MCGKKPAFFLFKELGCDDALVYLCASNSKATASLGQKACFKAYYYGMEFCTGPTSQLLSQLFKCL